MLVEQWLEKQDWMDSSIGRLEEVTGKEASVETITEIADIWRWFADELLVHAKELEVIDWNDIRNL